MTYYPPTQYLELDTVGLVDTKIEHLSIYQLTIPDIRKILAFKGIVVGGIRSYY